MNSQAGQTFIEFIASTLLVALTVVGTGWVLRAQWDRGRCAYLVFETTHAKLTGRPKPKARISISLSETPERVTGQGICGRAHEEVSLPKLESVRW